MTTGEKILSLSSLITGSALDHLQNVMAGGGGAIVYINGTLSGEVDEYIVEGTIDETAVTGEIDNMSPVIVGVLIP